MAHRRTPPYNTLSPRSTCMPFSACALCLSLCLSFTVYSVFSQPWLRGVPWERLRMQLQPGHPLSYISSWFARPTGDVAISRSTKHNAVEDLPNISPGEATLSLSPFFFIFCSFALASGNGTHHAPRFRYNEERNGETNLGGFSIKGNGCFLGNVRFILAGNGDRMDRGILESNGMVWIIGFEKKEFSMIF